MFVHVVIHVVLKERMLGLCICGDREEMVKGLKKIEAGEGNGLSRVNMPIGVECRYLENALQITAATVSSKLLITISLLGSTLY